MIGDGPGGNRRRLQVWLMLAALALSAAVGAGLGFIPWEKLFGSDPVETEGEQSPAPQEE